MALHPTLINNLELLKKRIYDKKKASLIIIDGFQGEGKTTLAVQVADYLEGKEINLETPEQLAVGGKDFQDKFNICIEKGYKVIIYDEAGDFDKYSTYTEFNKTLAQFFRMFRTYKILVIMVLPNFNDLDGRLFKNGVPRLLLHCQNKGRSYGNFKAYGLWRIEHLRMKLKLFSNKILPQEIYKHVRPNFMGRFYDLEKDRSLKLDKISTEGKNDIRIKTRIKETGLLSVKDIANELGRSLIWVKTKLASKELKPALVFKKAHYYEKDTLNILERLKK